MKALVPAPISGWFHLVDTEASEARPARFFTPDQAKAHRQQFQSLIAAAAPVASARGGEVRPTSPRPALGGC